MPKISLSSKNALDSGFGAQEGIWEIGRASAVVHQFPANSQTGEQRPPSTMVRLELYKLDPNTLERIDDESALEHMGFGGSNDLSKIRPGRLAKPEDNDPEDLGSALGTEGNSVYADPNMEIKVYKTCAWAKFVHSLEEKGFKQEILDTCYLPSLEGTKFEVQRLPGFKAPDDKSDRDRTILGVKKIFVYGYEKKPAKPAAKTPAPRSVTRGASAGASGAATATAMAPSGSPSPTPGPAPAPVNGQEQSDFDTIAIAGLGELSKQSKGREVKRGLFQASFLTYLMRHTKLQNEERKALMDSTIRDDEWLLANAAEQGIAFDPQAGTLQFP